MESVGYEIGVFRARVTRDGEALARDGHPYFSMNRLVERHRPEGERALFEIQFADGVWMLVREDDLVAGTIGPVELARRSWGALGTHKDEKRRLTLEDVERRFRRSDAVSGI